MAVVDLCAPDRIEGEGLLRWQVLLNTNLAKNKGQIKPNQNVPMDHLEVVTLFFVLSLWMSNIPVMEEVQDQFHQGPPEMGLNAL